MQKNFKLHKQEKENLDYKQIFPDCLLNLKSLYIESLGEIPYYGLPRKPKDFLAMTKNHCIFVLRDSMR